MSLLSSLQESCAYQRKRGRIIGTIVETPEFQRVLALPQRQIQWHEFDLTHYFARSGLHRLWPVQSTALVEAARAGGLCAFIGVGHGKTLIGLTLPEALDAQCAVYLVRSDLRRQLEHEISRFYDKHFRLALDRLHIVSYHDLSSMEHADVLERLQPDLIIADEGHCLKRPESARTRRFLRYFSERPTTRLAVLTGTPATRSILEYGHLLHLALKERTPLPRNVREMKDWAGALDVDPEYRMKPGALRKLCVKGEHVRVGYQRRLLSSCGVLATDELSVNVPLHIRRVALSIPPAVRKALETLEATWGIDGEEWIHATDIARLREQIACGFWYRLHWPEGKDHEWLAARSAWLHEVQDALRRQRAGLDSPLEVARAVERGELRSSAWKRWKEVRHRVRPERKAVWLSDYMIRAVHDWALRQHGNAIVWTRWQALGEAIAKFTAWPYYGEGTDASTAKDPIIVASVAAQGTGKNLQRYSHNLITTLPATGALFEQLIGRTHRPGQKAACVTADWFSPIKQFDQRYANVIEESIYLRDTLKASLKVLAACAE
jgi:hypothetical protein